MARQSIGVRGVGGSIEAPGEVAVKSAGPQCPMPIRRLDHAVRLDFNPGDLVHADLSGAAFSGEWLWVAGDEACGLSRLKRLDPVGRETLRYGEPVYFPLEELLELPADDEEEADFEGLAVDGGWLWLVGSHGLKRKNAKAGRSDADNAKRLAKVALDGNRRLLARVPIEPDADGAPRLVREAADGRRAMRLKGDARENELTRALADDPHVGPFLAIPGKDNGFDIEGLAVHGERLLLGLRGPVLRGWSTLLELRVGEHEHWLRLEGDPPVRKHFVDLHGFGVRDLQFDGDDLHLLAGPTMVLDGDIRLFRWPGARRDLGGGDDATAARFESGPQMLADLPHGRGCNRAEALCAVPDTVLPGARHWLVLYDAPGEDRRDGDAVFGDLLRAG